MSKVGWGFAGKLGRATQYREIITIHALVQQKKIRIWRTHFYWFLGIWYLLTLMKI
ncbi:MAG TPA: hypothetical protein VHY08_02500 [Bacillota bacterium]|nr:hypothetical protein [Bacillota bacterium]